jgi:hypothetical protein
MCIEVSIEAKRKPAFYWAFRTRKGERLSYSILWDGRDAKLVCGEKPVSSGDKTPSEAQRK